MMSLKAIVIEYMDMRLCNIIYTFILFTKSKTLRAKMHTVIQQGKPMFIKKVQWWN